jgi:hypothetical protein
MWWVKQGKLVPDQVTAGRVPKAGAFAGAWDFVVSHAKAALNKQPISSRWRLEVRRDGAWWERRLRQLSCAGRHQHIPIAGRRPGRRRATRRRGTIGIRVNPGSEVARELLGR